MNTTDDRFGATIISCDIVGHGMEPDHARQIDRIRALNEVVRQSLIRSPPGAAVWASGGDGGHVAFLAEPSLPDALALVQGLRDWAAAEAVALRITCHRGHLSTIEGADGRTQLVGDGINLCGSLVNFGAPGRIVATSAFRDFVLAADEASPGLPALQFIDERIVYLKHFEACTLCLLVFAGDRETPWELERSDQRQLRQAISVGNAWQVVYHMKRLLQVDSADSLALDALRDIDPRSLTHGQGLRPHPLLGFLPRPALVQLLRASELVERDDGDVICRLNDAGDSMFIVLRGQIGVVLRSPNDATTDWAPSDIRIGEGGMVGELALALHRPRTATLQAVGATALLALNYDALAELLQQVGPGSRLATSFKHFLEERIVEHLSRHCPYLRLDASTSSRTPDAEPWERLVDGVKRIEIDADQGQRLAYGCTADLGGTGIYLLASGDLREQSESDIVSKRLSGETFDLLFANLPGSVVSISQVYRFDTRKPHSRVTVIWITESALVEYAHARLPELIAQIRRRLASQMVFDAFLSYTVENVELATRWKAALEAAQLSVYMNAPAAMTRFEPEIDLALAESRVLVPFISRAALKSDWVQREIEKRKAIFDDRHSNILPIETEHRLAEQMVVGFSPINAGPRDSEEERLAMRRAIETIRDVARGRREPPFASRGPQR